MKVSDPATLYFMDSMIIEIPKYQVAMMAKKGAVIVDQVGNSYSMSGVMISYLTHHKC